RRTRPRRTTTMLSMRGENSGKTRSTPSPYDSLRTVNDELRPAFLRAMHTPSKAWMRSREPSTTLTLTRSVSPGANSGTSLPPVSLAICSLSNCWITLIVRILLPNAAILRSALGPFAARPQIGPPLAGDLFGPGQTPGPDTLMVPRQQHLRHRPLRAPPVAPDLRPGVVRIFEQPLLEAFLAQRGGVADHPGQQTDDGIDQGDRRRLAAGQDEIAETDLHQAARVDDALID